jgi:putative acetyltransferase
MEPSCCRDLERCDTGGPEPIKPKHMKIRKASAADKEKLSKMHIASIRKLCANHYTRQQLDAWTSVLVPQVYEQALKEKVVLTACDSGGDLSGLGILDIENKELSAVYVHPDVVGKGVGSKLLKALEKIAQSSGLIDITVHATLNAKGFYLAHGYLEQESTSHHLPNGSKLACIRMVKTLPKDGA